MLPYKQLEKKYAQFTGSQYAVSCNSGTSALHLALLAIGVGKGDEVIIPDFTMAACGFAVSYCGAKPVFVDCDDTLCMDWKLIEKKITRKTKAIMAVHIYGRLCNMKEILRIAKKYKLKVIEDACFVAGTKVLTSKGNKNIEDIEVGELVMTRRGYKKVLVSSMTGIKKVIKRVGITATPDHPIITTRGVKRLDSLNASDTLYKWNEKLLVIEEKNIIDIQNQLGEKRGSITGDTTLTNLHFRYIDKFGLITSGKFLKEWWYIIKMRIHSIMTFQILSYLQIPSIANYIATNQNESRSQQKIFLNSLFQKQQNGIEQIKEKSWVEKQPRFFGRINQLLQKCVEYVKNHIKVIFQLNQNTAQGNAKKNLDIVPVYNLTIEDCHEFFADNILVHNCEAQGAVFKSKADITCYSFYENKIIHAEEGGIATTDNKKYADRMNYLKNMAFGDKHDYFHKEIGYNYRMPNSQALLALKSLKNYPKENKRRRKAEKYFDGRHRDAVWVLDFMGKVGEKFGPNTRPFFKPLSSFPVYGNRCQSPKALYYSKRGHYIRL